MRGYRSDSPTCSGTARLARRLTTCARQSKDGTAGAGRATVARRTALRGRSMPGGSWLDRDPVARLGSPPSAVPGCRRSCPWRYTAPCWTPRFKNRGPPGRPARPAGPELLYGTGIQCRAVGAVDDRVDEPG
ncbi:hypothetical protein HBB16_08680 [Pseudonocardia sp. MCCB 268]|nr:hypothetical protein [Pseudonocardia cytotoxica]